MVEFTNLQFWGVMFINALGWGCAGKLLAMYHWCRRGQREKIIEKLEELEQAATALGIPDRYFCGVADTRDAIMQLFAEQEKK